ncbi:MAG: bifunctional DNA-formamidopyrimidine glycosylase/DNA-(apurinic or apyrimidinic site) lyase [Hyphomicrobiaceae bacterium]|nr:bifunctional DNA-formamidopyrimidine glycosylase/DNA-(apurinic or apyrimidinic site) lyase [Hyphomicrobiaceae bacterium]
MPELPEVETVCRGLAPVLAGQTIESVRLRRPDLRFPLPDRFAERLEGRRVMTLSRRAKYILAHLDDGNVLAMHLGMTGRFTVTPRESTTPEPLGDYVYGHGADAQHDHVVFRLKGGAIITYNDARRFGYMSLIAAAGLAQDPFFANLGVEPLSEALTPDYVAAKARGRKSDVKAFLMDQRIIAGLGNIYVCEALYRARIKPTLAAGRLARQSGKPADAALRLVPQIKAVLGEAIVAGGSTLRDYQHTDGSAGSFQESFSVYGREGEPCLTAGCRGTVRRTTQAGRSTFHCPQCQR